MPDETPEHALSQDALAELARCDLTALSEKLWSERWLVHASVVSQLADAVRQTLRIDTDRALHLAEISVVIAGQLGDPVSLGLSLRAKGNALWFRNNLRSATTLFDQAVHFFEEAGAVEEIGRTLSSSIQSLSLLGEYKRASLAADRARKIFESLADEHRLARLDINVANMYHRQDRFAEAVSLYRHAYEQLLRFRDSEAIGAALHNMAVCLIMLNDFDEAVRTLSVVRAMSDREMPLLSRQADYNLAYLYFLRGDYDDALARLSEIRGLCRRDGDTYHQALCDLDESEIYLELNLPGDAAKLARAAIAKFRRLDMRFEQGRAAVNFALASHKTGDPVRALALLRLARKIFSEENNSAWGALVAVYESVVLFDKGRFRAASARCRHALDYFASAGLERREIFCNLVLVRIFLKLSRTDSAHKLCRTALRKLRKVDAPSLLFQACLLMGHIAARRRADAPARRYYERARLQLERLRSTVHSDELKIAFMRDKQELYEALVLLCLTSDTAQESAFEYIEQAKSRSLMDLVTGRSLPVPGGTDQESADRIDNLRRELNWYYHRLELEQTPKEQLAPERIHVLRVELAAREEEFLRAYRENWTSSSRKGPFAEISSLPLTNIQSTLGPDITLIEYFELNQSSLVVILTADSLQVLPLGAVAEVNRSLQMLEFQMARMTMQGRTAALEEQLTRAVTSRLRDLYAKVFAPVAARVTTKQLVIVPHGALHCLPFHALMDGDTPLIDRFTISYAPSASVYAACAARQANTTGISLLLGVPDQAAPFIAAEIESVASAVPSPRRAMGSEATRSLLDREGIHARIIHVSTHGVFRRDNPALSAVRLGDGYLNLTDLYELNLPVELITLSGCGTGLAEVGAGDEVVGLSRGLLSAGARSALVTLWDVQDQITAELMHLFYQQWHLLGDKAMAINSAMKEIRISHPHPYFWAPFILIGSRTNNGCG